MKRLRQEYEYYEKWFNNIPNDIINIICNLIYICDLGRLSRVSVTNNKIIKPFLNNRMITNKNEILSLCTNACEYYIENVKKIDIKKLLLNENGFICGGFVSDYITRKYDNENIFDVTHPRQWTDIDIFLPYKEDYNKIDNVNNMLRNYLNFGDLLKGNSVKYHHYIDNKIEEYQSLEHIKLLYNISINMNLSQYKSQRLIIQLLFIDHNEFGSIKTYVHKYFDLSCCMCWYDGNNIDCDNMNFYDIIKGRAKVNKDEIIRRTNNNSYYKDIENRINKYIKRGFMITNWNVKK
jgi:hypothetical protein